MKKVCLILSLLILPFAAAREEVPILIDNASIVTEYEEPDLNMINTDNMRRSEKIKEAQQEASKNNQTSRLKLDTRAINHQRALDFTTKQNNSMLPLF